MPLLIFLLLFFALPARAGEEKPLLQLDPGGHLALVRDIAFTPDGKQLVSAGEDKTIRVWEVDTGQTVRVLRGQIGESHEGKIYAMALSPNGEWLAAGGRFHKDDPVEGSAIRLYHFPSGELRGLLKGHENVVNALAFSPDSQRLVSGSGDKTARVWDIRDNIPSAGSGHRPARDVIPSLVLRGHTDAIYAVAFTPDGQRVVTGSDDHSLRLWRAEDGEVLNVMEGHSDKVYAVAVSAQNLIASGSDDHTIRLWDGDSGEFLRELANQGTVVGSLSFSPDGGRLLSGNGAPKGPFYCHLWSVADDQELQRYTGHDNVVIATAISPDGRWAATGGGDNQEIHVWDTQTGEVRQRLAGHGRAVWAVGFSRDGRAVMWGNTEERDSPTDRGPLEYRLALPGKKQAVMGEPEQMPSLEEMASVRAQSTWETWSLHTRLGGNYGMQAILEIRQKDKLQAEIERGATDGYRHNSYTFTQDGQRIVSGGGNGVLSLYDRQGRKLGDFVGHTGDVWAVAISPDGRLLASGSADQTVRLWNVETRELLVTVFYAPSFPEPVEGNEGALPLPSTSSGSGKAEWVMWTPQGYYAASPDGDRMIGWQINREVDQNPDYISATQLNKHFYRPDIVAQAVALGSAEQAVARAKNTDFTLADLLKKLPPAFEIVKTETEGQIGYVTLRFAEGRGADSVETFVNGGKVTSRDPVLPPRDGRREIRVAVPLAPGDNPVEIVASNATGETRGQVPFKIDALAEEKPGDLYLLAIGVNDYPAGLAPLAFAAPDAHALHEALLAQKGKVFANIHSLLLAAPYGKPTVAAVRDGLKLLKEAQSPNDTVVLFIAGHGVNQDGEYYFLPQDARFSENGALVPDSALPWHELHAALQAAKGRRVLLVDTCRAANAYNPRLMKDAQFDNIAAFSATGSEGVAQELAKFEHGAFTYALLNGLGKEADADQDGLVKVMELPGYLMRKVKELTQGSQQPKFTFSDMADFPLARWK